ncbi:MAG: hypothetical protein A2Z24_00830 [Candidatus Woykebacteria bacterium RBG_16_44_10]|uniref:Uncharacterized protein n=1 Tax=Candidatus Woykebacteria bacterium RBG_16_44_10 TaxID=1802597 RepID=A0A1G1WFX0_9BACT|nr:MAG: hypothetical protein A2Z24_00830 [Candidatus Woykebacteria bacterium RBG_16_44_10]
MPAGILACYVLFNENGWIPIGGAVFSNGRIQYQGKYLDFSRLWLDDSAPKNSESFFIGKCLKLLQKKYPSFIGIVTYADPNHGYSGTIYKASNFIFDGMSRIVKKYISRTGTTVYQRTVTNPSSPLYSQIESDKPKIRFIYYFNKKTRESKRKHRLV